MEEIRFPDMRRDKNIVLFQCRNRFDAKSNKLIGIDYFM